MTSGKTPEYILLSALIGKLENNDYYRVFAKSLARTARPAGSLPPDDELVREMFHYFIKENELPIHYQGSVASLDFVESEIHRRAAAKAVSGEDLERTRELEGKLVWEKEVSIRVQDLKKLYANKCIVFPKSLLAEKNTSRA